MQDASFGTKIAFKKAMVEEQGVSVSPPKCGSPCSSPSKLQKRSGAMTLSVIVAVVIVAAGLYWLIRSSRKEAHHLDDLHITPEAGEKED